MAKPKVLSAFPRAVGKGAMNPRSVGKGALNPRAVGNQQAATPQAFPRAVGNRQAALLAAERKLEILHRT